MIVLLYRGMPAISQTPAHLLRFRKSLESWAEIANASRPADYWRPIERPRNGIEYSSIHASWSEYDVWMNSRQTSMQPLVGGKYGCGEASELGAIPENDMSLALVNVTSDSIDDLLPWNSKAPELIGPHIDEPEDYIVVGMVKSIVALAPVYHFDTVSGVPHESMGVSVKYPSLHVGYNQNSHASVLAQCASSFRSCTSMRSSLAAALSQIFLNSGSAT